MHTMGCHKLAVGMPLEQIRRFHDVLTRADYTEAGLVGALGPISLPTRLKSDRAHFLHLTGRGRPLDFQVRLFLLGLPATLEEARAALDPVRLEDWVQAGLLAIDGGKARGLVRIMAFRNLLLACEQYEASATPNPADAVMPISSSSSTLADFMATRHSRATLDIGTGSGLQAFIAAAHSDRVYAVDRSARAINFARFNAALNAAPPHVEFLEGDGFEPVRGRMFDLIVSNPPFAITPGVRYLYRDSGVPADGFARGLVKNAARHLNEGGLCQLVCDCVHYAGQDWKERLAGWFDETGCDAWVIRTDMHDAAEYAHMWVRDTEQAAEEEEKDRIYCEWMSYYERERIERISTVLIAMRKADGTANSVRIEETAPTVSGAFGDRIILGFELGDFLRTVSADDALLDTRLAVSPSARLDHVCEWSDCSWRIRSATIRLADGLQYDANFDLRLAGMVALCDGAKTMREVIASTAAAVDADFDRIAPNCLLIVRQLIERGFLLPAAATGSLQKSDAGTIGV